VIPFLLASVAVTAMATAEAVEASVKTSGTFLDVFETTWFGKVVLWRWEGGCAVNEPSRVDTEEREMSHSVGG
jgi:hypothetical protein